jgi:hypothetical protein
MNETTQSVPARGETVGLPRNLLLGVLLVVLFVVGGLLAYQIVRGRQVVTNTTRLAEIQTRQADAIADEFGFRVKHVAMLADGGMFELRFQVVDPDKANLIFVDLESVPVIVDEDTGTVIAVQDLPHTHNVPAGLFEYVIYVNLEGAVKPGDVFTIGVGYLELQIYLVSHYTSGRNAGAFGPDF